MDERRKRSVGVGQDRSVYIPPPGAGSDQPLRGGARPDRVTAREILVGDATTAARPDLDGPITNQDQSDESGDSSLEPHSPHSCCPSQQQVSSQLHGGTQRLCSIACNPVHRAQNMSHTTKSVMIQLSWLSVPESTISKQQFTAALRAALLSP